MINIKEKGFSLFEIMLASSIGAVVLLASVQYFTHLNKDISKAQDTIIDTISGLNFEMAMSALINNAKYSYNTLLLEDDNKLLFFDYLPEGKCSAALCSRTLTLKKGNSQGSKSKEMYFIIKDNSSTVEQIFNPKDAYLPPKVRATDDSNLIFKSLNQNNYLAQKPFSPWVVDSLSNKEQLILIYSPYMVYSDIQALGSSPGKMIQFMGWLNSSNIKGALVRERISVAGGNLYNDSDPRTEYKDFITTEDLMLKRTPALSGIAAFVMIASVKVVRLRIETQVLNGKLVGVLYADALNSNNQYLKTVMSSGVDQVVFRRSSINNAEINVDILYTK